MHPAAPRPRNIYPVDRAAANLINPHAKDRFVHIQCTTISFHPIPGSHTFHFPKPRLCVVLRLVVTHGPWKLPEQLSIFINQFVPARLSRSPRHPRSYRISRRYARCLARTLCAQFRTRERSVGGIHMRYSGGVNFNSN